MSRPLRTIRAAAWREVRTSVAVLAVLYAGVIVIGLRSYVASGGAPGMAGLQPLVQNPAVAALYGRVSNLANAGIFVVWKMGTFLLLVVALWAALNATRMTRGHSIDITLDRSTKYELDGGARKARKTYKVRVKPGAITVRVPPPSSE